MSTATIFGGAAIGRVTQEEADKILEILLEYGVNHIDTAASYGDSELRIGPWMENHRNKFFLATKTGKRTYKEAKIEIEKSLERLRVEKVDLLQLHNLVHPDDWDIAMGKNGALEAAIEAKEQGLTRYLGVTGHGLLVAAMHRRSLKRFPFDSVLLPWNYVLSKEGRYALDFASLVEECRERGIAVQTIKSVTKGPWCQKEHKFGTWYEPLDEKEDIDRAVSWILGQGYIFLNTAADTKLLPKILDSANRFKDKPSNESMELMVKERKMTRLFVS
ncbi:aldo/keto reductase [Candidatus Bathyarchaeota archaeon]|nr:aldo/keto reductase [Candidatus Bathyarchaeota archaeon]